jgi:hypothetical protein
MCNVSDAQYSGGPIGSSGRKQTLGRDRCAGSDNLADRLVENLSVGTYEQMGEASIRDVAIACGSTPGGGSAGLSPWLAQANDSATCSGLDWETALKDAPQGQNFILSEE